MNNEQSNGQQKLFHIQNIKFYKMKTKNEIIKQ
jgi:hypothetical protein